MGPLFGWAGNILKVDLSTATIQTIDTERYVPKYLGGKGLIHRIAWDEIPRGTGAFDPDNRLILAVGPLTGTPAPTSGRAEIGGVAPQSNPEMYSHSGIGGRIGAELKYAGFDAIIIHGKASNPCYLWINDGICEIKDASQLWGLSTYSTQLELQNIHGKNITSLTIGPAGEHESRIAVLITGSHNAAGQGGFGGVAGSKNLKAISIKGSKNVRIACPDKLLGIRRNISKPQYKNPLTMESKFEYDGHLVDGRLFRKFHTACSHACDRYCATALMGIPESTRPGVHDIKVPA
jgi:aldehyde:ferredoxin oxidoreductase